ncbi:type 2 lanthipeptide synthetase LanM [Microbacterium lacticum]
MKAHHDLAAYYEAAALNERDTSLPESADEQALSQAASWRSRALTDDSVFTRYLDSHHLSAARLEGLLSGKPWSARPERFQWTRDVESWLIAPSLDGEPYCPGQRGIPLEGTLLRSLPFPGLFTDIVTHQRSHLASWPWLSEEAVSSLLDGLAARVVAASIRTLISELATLSSPSRGPGSYAGLDRTLGTRAGRQRLFARQPVLARDLVTSILSWRQHTAHVLCRLADDISALHAHELLTTDLRDLTEVAIDQGDRHDGGQTVSILRFGATEKIVYKPRDCNIYALYEQVTAELNSLLPADEQLRAARCVARADYGWVEYVQAADADIADLNQYLRRLGALLAVAHVLGASDMHMENVLATADGPVPIDLETLIQNRSETTTATYAAQKAVSQLNTSVLGTGILPMYLKTGEGTNIDVSVATGGLSIDAVTAVGHQLLDPCTDTMRIEAVTMKVGRMSNQPPNMTVDFIRDGRGQIGEGYQHAYLAAVATKAGLRRIVRAWPSMELRHIARPTRSYSLLLTEMRQPGRLRSGIDRDALYRSLWARIADHPDETALVAQEETALWTLDVPLFTTRMDSRGLFARGREIIPDYFSQTALADVEDRIDSLDASSLPESTRLISEAIIAVAPVDLRAPEPAGLDQPLRMHAGIDIDTVVSELAYSQAVTLITTAIRGEDDATWISICSSEDSTGFEYQPLGPTLYDGLAGVGLAATYAHRQFPSLGLDDLARRVMRAVSSILTDWTNGHITTLPIGAYSGVSGLLYALSHYEAVLGEGEYRQLRIRVAEHLQHGVAGDRFYDVMAGAAGACAVIATDESIPRDVRERTLRVLVEHLVAQSIVTSDAHRVWETGTARARLGGFSHGSTGIGWALARAATALGDQDVASIARQALRYDDTLFRADKHGWIDARPESTSLGEAFPKHWCHGSAGISMARADAAQLLDTDEFLELATIGAGETLTSTLPSDDSLCHGSLGNWMALRPVATQTRIHDLHNTYRNDLAQRIRAGTLRSGLPRGITSVRGLMLGTAGALYAFTAMRDSSIPNLLLLEPPHVH